MDEDEVQNKYQCSIIITRYICITIVCLGMSYCSMAGDSCEPLIKIKTSGEKK